MTTLPIRRQRRALLASLTLLGAVLVSGCSGTPEIVVPSVATIQVIDQTYKIQLDTEELVHHAHELLAGGEEGRIPLGTIVRDDPSINEPWSWHIDPATLEFADATIEVCDGLPEYVEDGTLTSDVYCPWSAEVIAVEPLEE